MLLSLVGAIFGALKAWVIWWCWDVFGRVLPGVEMGGLWTFSSFAAFRTNCQNALLVVS
jgi:hypothetical protein